MTKEVSLIFLLTWGVWSPAPWLAGDGYRNLLRKDAAPAAFAVLR